MALLDVEFGYLSSPFVRGSSRTQHGDETFTIPDAKATESYDNTKCANGHDLYEVSRLR